MAMENSSSVLDLNDVDGDDTDTASITDGAQDGVPLIMEHGHDIAVKVDAPIKQLSTLETFVTYRVRCVCARWPTPSSVRRRYNQFKVLHRRLVAAHPLLAPPPLPALHSARQQLDRYGASFVHTRARALNVFLDLIAKHPILTYSEDFRIFLTTPDEEFDKIFKSESSSLSLWGLGSALYRDTNQTTNGARVKDPEFSSKSDYLESLEHKLNTLSELTDKLYKGSSSLGKEYMNMKRVCDAWTSGERGRASRATGAVAEAAHANCAALLQPRATPAHTSHDAVLPLLANYCRAHRDKIRQRDQQHAAYVSGVDPNGELQNRLEQASEAIRSEMSDWQPKTRAEIKRQLLDIADRQVNIYTQSLLGWERALHLASNTDIDQIFKTVSKTAVHNLSPSKSRLEFGTSPEAESTSDQCNVPIEDIKDGSLDKMDQTKQFSDVDLSS